MMKKTVASSGAPARPWAGGMCGRRTCCSVSMQASHRYPYTDSMILVSSSPKSSSASSYSLCSTCSAWCCRENQMFCVQLLRPPPREDKITLWTILTTTTNPRPCVSLAFRTDQSRQSVSYQGQVHIFLVKEPSRVTMEQCISAICLR